MRILKMRNPGFIGLILIISLCSCISANSSIQEQTNNKSQSGKARLLSKVDVDLFDFFMGIDTWKSVWAWIMVLFRYIGLIMVIVGSLISVPGKNNGWTRMIRYVSFIYGVSFFWFNLVINTESAGVQTESLSLERSNFQTMYDEYNDKSLGYLFSFERYNIFPVVQG